MFNNSKQMQWMTHSVDLLLLFWSQSKGEHICFMIEEGLMWVVMVGDDFGVKNEKDTELGLDKKGRCDLI